MSAIVGIFYLDGRKVETVAIEQMLDRLAHRGADLVGVWEQNSIGLGQRLLWTTPESRLEKLPLISQDQSLALISDARIDNRMDLIRQLDFSGREATSVTDSELILQSYRKWGRVCPEHFVGDFAFAIWDAGKQALFCARDHMGVKPFYYYHSDKLFAFASEIKSLFCLPEIPRRLNEVHLGEQMALSPGEYSTYFLDINRLRGGHSLRLSPAGIRIWRYWDYDSIRQVRFKQDEEYYEAFRDIMAEAVRCRMRSDYPAGSSLSGGLDSSSIACLARDFYQQAGYIGFNTFSAIFPGLPDEDLRIIDERKYMAAVIQQGGFIPNWIEADQLSPVTDVRGLLWQDDEPIGAPNVYMHAAMYKVAHNKGVRIFLDGIDGDTAITYGYQYLAELTRQGRWIKLYRESNAIAQTFTESRSGTRKIIWRHGFRPLMHDSLINFWQSARGRKQPSLNAKYCLNPNFSRRMQLNERLQDSAQSAWQLPSRQHWNGIIDPVNGYVLEIADKTSSRYSVQGCYPFFDRRVLEFAVILPSRFKLHQGWDRFILRQAMEDILPEEVRWRRVKSNLSPNFQRRFLEVDLIGSEFQIVSDFEVLRPYMDIDALNEYYKSYLSQPAQSSHEALIIFRAYVLAKWLRFAF